MFKKFMLKDGRPAEDAGGNIHVFMDPDEAERARLINEFRIDEHNMTSSLDLDEQPRVELEEDHLALIFKYPKRYDKTDDFIFRVHSVGLFLFKSQLVIIASSDLPLFEGRMFHKINSLQTLFLRALSSCIQHFYGHLKAISSAANELETKIMHAMENQTLITMFNLEKSLVYYVNAISANGRAIERLKANAKNTSTEGLSSEQIEYLDDLAIENAQCHEQAQIYANVLTGLMDARASIVSNNLNVLMKRLTVINVVFMPLNVIAGIGGMSEFSTWTTGIPWPIAYSVFLFGLGIIGLITYYILRRDEQKTIGK